MMGNVYDKFRKELKQVRLDKDEFIFGKGKTPQFQCTLCGDKAWYVGFIQIWCSNKECQWYHDPFKKEEDE